MNIVLIRHGQAVCNTMDDNEIIFKYDICSELTGLGKEQALLLTEGFPEKYRPGIIFSSQLTRARETAMPLSELYGLDIITDCRLDEMRTPEIFSQPIPHSKWDELLEQRVLNPENEVMPGIESVRSHYERVKAFLDEVLADEQLKDKNVVIFTHAFTIEMAMLYFLRLDISCLASSRFRISNTGVYIISSEGYDQDCEIITTNNRTHLKKV